MALLLPKAPKNQSEAKRPSPANVAASLFTIQKPTNTAVLSLMKSKIILFVLLVPILAAFFFVSNLSSVSVDSSPQTFVVNQGDSLTTIANRLESNGLIKNRYAFIVYSKLTGFSTKLQAGGFRLSPNQSIKDIVLSLSQGGSYDYWLTILPGWRLEQVQQALDNRFSIPDKLEGYLFPDSYLLPDYYDLSQILDVISKNFSDKVGSVTPDTIILASLLEREAKTEKDKQIVAGILQNRLDLDMALQVDATVQYARDSLTPKPEKYWLPVTKAQLSIDSAYNTYQHTGLPPGPICNPSLESITAAQNPSPSDYLFYISEPDGTMHYAKTLDQHNINVQTYLR